jgi:hypothetical protein
MRTDAFQFADTKLSGVVRCGLHAVAVDEQRADFTPTLWDSDTRVEQVLFPGAHSDVGGGYPLKGGQSGLSDCALGWMMERLSALGLRFSPAPVFVPTPDVRAAAHQPWLHAPWHIFPRTARTFRMPLTVHPSVRERMTCGPVACEPGVDPLPYAPTNLPV